MGVAFGLTFEGLRQGEDSVFQTLSENEKKNALDVLHLNSENTPKKLSVSAELKLHMDKAKWYEKHEDEWKKSGFATDSSGFMAMMRKYGLMKEWAKLMKAIKEAKKGGSISDASLGRDSFWALLHKYGLTAEWTKRMELIRKFKEVIGSALGRDFFWARLYDCSKAEHMLSTMEAARQQNLETKIGCDDGANNWKIAANDYNNQKEALELMKRAEGTAVFSCVGCGELVNMSRERDLYLHFWTDKATQLHPNVIKPVCFKHFKVNAQLHLFL